MGIAVARRKRSLNRDIWAEGYVAAAGRCFVGRRWPRQRRWNQLYTGRGVIDVRSGLFRPRAVIDINKVGSSSQLGRIEVGDLTLTTLMGGVRHQRTFLVHGRRVP